MRIKNVIYITILLLFLVACGGSSSNTATSEKVNLRINISNLMRTNNHSRAYIDDINSIVLDIVAQNDEDTSQNYELIDRVSSGSVSLDVQLFTGITYDFTLRTYIYQNELYCEATDTLTPSLSGNNSVNLNCTLTPNYENTDPIADFTYSSNSSNFVYIDDNITFTNNSTETSTFGWESCIWDFGDGTTFDNCSQILNYTYGTANSYSGSLTVTNNRGATATLSKSIDVLPIVSSSRTYVPTATSTNEEAYAVIKTDLDGYVISGRSSDGVPYLLNTNNIGNLNWQYEYVDSGIIFIMGILQTSDGGFLLSGASGRNALVVKLSNNGSMVWSKYYGDNSGLNFNYLTSSIELDNGNYLLAGYTNSYNPEYAGWLVEITPNGTTNKSIVYPFYLGSTGDHISFLSLTKNSNKIFVGGDYNVSATDNSILVALDDNLTILNNNVINAINGTQEQIEGLKVASDGNLFFTSTEGIFGKLYDNGTVMWAKQVTDNISTPMQLANIIETRDQNLFIPTNTTNTPILLKLSNTGVKTWEKSYKDNATEAKFYNITLSFDNTPAMAGYRDYGVNNDIWFLKLDRNGQAVNIVDNASSALTTITNVTPSSQTSVTIIPINVGSDNVTYTNSLGTFTTTFQAFPKGFTSSPAPQ